MSSTPSSFKKHNYSYSSPPSNLTETPNSSNKSGHLHQANPSMFTQTKISFSNNLFKLGNHEKDFAKIPVCFNIMNFAIDICTLSSDYNTKCSCVIVDLNFKIIGYGYNANPYGIHDDIANENNKILMVHSEQNAILHQTCEPEAIIVFCTRIPCSQCIKLLMKYKIVCIILMILKDCEEPLYVCNKNDITIIKYDFLIEILKQNKYLFIKNQFDNLFCKSKYREMYTKEGLVEDFKVKLKEDFTIEYLNDKIFPENTLIERQKEMKSYVLTLQEFINGYEEKMKQFYKIFDICSLNKSNSDKITYEISLWKEISFLSESPVKISKTENDDKTSEEDEEREDIYINNYDIANKKFLTNMSEGKFNLIFDLLKLHKDYTKRSDGKNNFGLKYNF